ncbi:MAG TPA: toll/interleukin-1 receptor domain-containing protein [Bacteroidales bacterium]|nr:toll/interleukin-1 receptor domain-containing protein [Bacteroidales bacterium]
MNLEDLPESIGDYKKRIFAINNFVVIEYSKNCTFQRFLSGIDMDTDDVMFDEMAANIDDAVRQTWVRINMPNQIRNDFPECIALPQVSPAANITNDKGTKITIKPLDLFYLWNVAENYQHIAIVLADVKNHYKNIPEVIDFFIEQNKIGNFIKIQCGDLDSQEYVFTNMIYLYTDKLNIEKNEILNYFKSKKMKLEIRDDEYRKNIYESKRPDFFICHDTRDKKTVADPLYNELKKMFVKVWYDKYSLEIGDSLTESIEKGIRECRYGIIILSKNFLSNEKWAKYELQSLKTKQIIGNKKTILPIWHGINEDDLKEYSYWLIDKVGGNTNEGFELLAKKLRDIVVKTKTKK